MTEKVLIVDDDTNLLAGLKRHLRRRFEVATAESGEQALDLVKSDGPFAVTVCDMRMRGMNGVEVLAAVKKLAPDTVRIMLTGNADEVTSTRAVNEGAIFRFFTKPCPPETLAKGIEAGIEQYRLITAERELLSGTFSGAVKVLTDVLAITDPQGFSTSTKVHGWMRGVAAHLQFPQPWQLEIAAMLSRIGQVAVPPELLAKKRADEPVTKVEEEIIARVPETGRNLLANIPRMKSISEMVYYQDKGFDGSGFPKDGVSGEDIPLGSRVLKVLNDLAKVTTGPFPSSRAVSKIELNKGRYDPKILAAVRDFFRTQTKHPTKDDAVVVELPVSLLRAGYLLETDLELQNGRLYLAAGSRLSQTHVEHIRNLSKLQRFKEPVQVTRPAKAI